MEKLDVEVKSNTAKKSLTKDDLKYIAGAILLMGSAFGYINYDSL